MDIKKYIVNLPYTKVAGKVSSEVLALLQEAYSGRVSEASAVFQYMYQHYNIEDSCSDIAEMLKGIAIAEMHHHEMLAKSIIALGGDPIIAGRCAFFSGSYVDYIKSPRACLSADIEAEKKAISDYHRIVIESDNESLRMLINRIIMDEELHLNLLENGMRRLEGG